jgi:tRNA(adenine34) deaminase
MTVAQGPGRPQLTSLDASQASQDEHWMRLALEEAYAGDRTPGAGEVGCVIVRESKLLVRGHNEAEMRHDPTAHAEIVCLRSLGQKLGVMEFPGCTLYCTLQPCSMCAAACVWAGVKRVVYGAGRGDVHADYFDARHLNAADVLADAYREDISIVGGVLRAACAELYAKPDGSPADKNGLPET